MAQQRSAKATQPKTDITLRKLLLTVVLALIVLSLLDPLLENWLERYFPETPGILHTFSSLKGLDSFWKMSQANRMPIVFVGSSSAFEGITPYVFDETVQKVAGTAVVSVNVNITGSVSLEARDLIRDVIIPGGNSAVLYMTEMRAFAEKTGLLNYQNSPLGYTMEMSSGLPKNVGLWLLQHSAWFRYRNNFHDLVTGKRRLQPELENWGFIDDRGYYARNEARAVGWPVSVPNEFTPININSFYQKAFEEIISVCQQTQSRCIIVHMPIFHSLYETIKPEEVQQFNDMVKTTIGSTSVAFWNFNTDACRDALGLDAFADPVHLGTVGSVRYTKMLAELYASQYLNMPLSAESPARCAILFNTVLFNNDQH